MSSAEYRLIINCPDKVGIVAEVSRFIAGHGGSITEANHHSDLEHSRFFMRNEFSCNARMQVLQEGLEGIAKQFAMRWQLKAISEQPSVVLMASKEPHCLIDLLQRRHSGDLDINIVAVVSNHRDLEKQVSFYNIPFHYVPIDSRDKDKGFDLVAELWRDYNAELVVLARYMQIIPPRLCADYPQRVINIHHSFLPSFAGAQPYKQAFDKGVKMIGATCHYVTAELDQGPIIDQDVIRVGHQHRLQDMIRLGRDIERVTLARGVKSHLEDRVLVHQGRTVVFS